MQIRIQTWIQMESNYSPGKFFSFSGRDTFQTQLTAPVHITMFLLHRNVTWREQS